MSPTFCIIPPIHCSFFFLAFQINYWPINHIMSPVHLTWFVGMQMALLDGDNRISYWYKTKQHERALYFHSNMVLSCWKMNIFIQHWTDHYTVCFIFSKCSSVLLEQYMVTAAELLFLRKNQFDRKLILESIQHHRHFSPYL